MSAIYSVILQRIPLDKNQKAKRRRKKKSEMGGSDDNELSLSSNIGGCGVIGAVNGGVKAAWALAPTGNYQFNYI